MKIKLIIGKIVDLAANPFDGTDDLNSTTFSAALSAAKRGIQAFEEANLFERDASVEDAALSITWWWWNHHAPKPTRKQAAEIRRLGRKALKRSAEGTVTGEGPVMITPYQQMLLIRAQCLESINRSPSHWSETDYSDVMTAQDQLWRWYLSQDRELSKEDSRFFFDTVRSLSFLASQWLRM